MSFYRTSSLLPVRHADFGSQKQHKKTTVTSRLRHTVLHVCTHCSPPALQINPFSSSFLLARLNKNYVSQKKHPIHFVISKFRRRINTFNSPESRVQTCPQVEHSQCNLESSELNEQPPVRTAGHPIPGDCLNSVFFLPKDKKRFLRPRSLRKNDLVS